MWMVFPIDILWLIGRGFFNISAGAYGGVNGLLILFFASERQIHTARSQQIQLVVYNLVYTAYRIDSLSRFLRKISTGKLREIAPITFKTQVKTIFSISIITGYGSLDRVIRASRISMYPRARVPVKPKRKLLRAKCGTLCHIGARGKSECIISSKKKIYMKIWKLTVFDLTAV